MGLVVALTEAGGAFGLLGKNRGKDHQLGLECALKEKEGTILPDSGGYHTPHSRFNR